jgi:hypothetical protein
MIITSMSCGRYCRLRKVNKRFVTLRASLGTLQRVSECASEIDHACPDLLLRAVPVWAEKVQSRLHHHGSWLLLVHTICDGTVSN